MFNSNPFITKSSLSIWLSYLENLHHKTIDMGLERINQVAVNLNLLKPAPFIFTVGGTNGKGTTCKTIESILISAGYKVGTYNSPHLIRYTERIRIQNSELPESAHITAFEIIEKARCNVSLTFFEFSTLSALWLFKQAKLDVVILEVGLGGRLDATNIVDSDVAVITNIALDHTDWLGSEYNSIGREKAGIFRKGKPAVVGLQNVPKSVTQIAKEKNTKLSLYGIHWNFIQNKYGWSFKDKEGEIYNLPIPHVPQLSAAIALAALRASKLNIKEKSIKEGISKAVLAGRFQIISQSPRLILDVAHNPNAAKYLYKKLKMLPNSGRILAVIGMLQDKDIAGTMACIEDAIDCWYCASLEEPRGANGKYLIKYINKEAKVYASVIQAWNAAMSLAKPKDTVLVFGSFQTVGSVIKAMGEGDIF